MKRENWNVKSYGFIQQLEFRWVRSTNNETPVERNRSTCRQHYGVIVKF